MSKTISSEKVTIERKAEDVFHFLADFTNFGHLMPEQVINYQATADTCSFEIKGLTSLSMKITERVEPSKVVIANDGKTPFAYTLVCLMEPAGDTQTQAQLVFNAELNAMMAMMVTTPLTNFVNILVNQLKKHLESD